MVELKWKISELELQNVTLREDNRKLGDEIRISRTKLTKIDDEKSKLSKLLQQRQTELSKNETNKIGFEGDLKRFQLLLQEKEANLSVSIFISLPKFKIKYRFFENLNKF